jgi:translation initiation factor IF-2
MSQVTRPPVITVMGHVDHGKTTLLDYIRKSNVQSRETGGMTQHIGAYQINYQGKKITFIDTPGHAAFSKMRERGANATDIIVLVVAANDGVKPQTIESIRHIKNSGAQVIVALNKIDLPDLQKDVVKGQLAEHGLVVTDYGGNTEIIELSAKSGKNVDKLLETISLMSEMADLKADPEAPLEAIVIESTKDKHKGSVASVIVQQGTLKVKQNLTVMGKDGEKEIDGRVKALFDEDGQALKEAGPSDPAEVIGLNDVPPVGSIIKDADAEYPQVEVEAVEEVAGEDDPWGDLDFEAAFGEKEKIKLIAKADVEGTLEVVEQNLDPDNVDLVSSSVGAITERDIEMAEAAGAVIIAFRVKVPGKTKKLAKQAGVKIKTYDVIYKLIEDLQKKILKLMEPTIDEVQTGEAEVLQIFEMKGMKIAGCKVITGQIKKTDKLHLKRGDEIIADPTVRSMMHNKQEIDVANTKNEFALTFKQKKLDFQVGDKITAYYEEE